MAVVYVGLALIVVGMNITEFPGFIADIFAGAFGLREGLAGVAGGVSAALLNGVRRGLFSNEAGMGTNPNAAATATVAHPAQQGFIQAFGVFFDTFFVCTSTAFIILSAGPSVYQPGVTGADPADGDLSGVLTTNALASQLGDWVPIVMVIVVFFFGYSSILGAFAYAEANIVFLRGGRWGTNLAKIAAVITSYIGAIATVYQVFILMDTFMALVTLVNLIALLSLGKHVAAILKDYERQKKAGIEEPKFVAAEAGLPAGTVTDWWGAQDASTESRQLG